MSDHPVYHHSHGECDACDQYRTDKQAELSAAHARLRECETDAKRYKFLRENWYYDVVAGHQQINGMTADIVQTVDGAEMDTAVDAAIAALAAEGDKCGG